MNGKTSLRTRRPGDDGHGCGHERATRASGGRAGLDTRSPGASDSGTPAEWHGCRAAATDIEEERATGGAGTRGDTRGHGGTHRDTRRCPAREDSGPRGDSGPREDSGLHSGWMGGVWRVQSITTA